MQRTNKKILSLLLLLLPFVAVMYVTEYPLKAKIEAKLSELMKAQSLDDVQMTISNLTQQNITFSRIAFKQGDKDIELKDLSVTATSLPYKELLQKNYANVAAEWSLGAVTVNGLPYELPPLSGEGVFYMKDEKPVITGTLHDEKNTHQGEFTVTSKAVLLENILLVWQGAAVSTKEVVIILGEDKQPIRIPLTVKNLPLPVLLSMISSDKATGTGNVTGNVSVVVNPDGSFELGAGKFGAVQEGVIQISGDVLPGDNEQLKMAREALSNFHYKELNLTTSSTDKGKTNIHLNIEGNNPAFFDGRPIKLNVNLTGDVLELIQQTVMPMVDPTKFIEKETK